MKQKIANAVILLCLVVGACTTALAVEAGFLWVIGQELGHTAESWFGHIIAVVFGGALLWALVKDWRRAVAKRTLRKQEAEPLSE